MLAGARAPVVVLAGVVCWELLGGSLAASRPAPLKAVLLSDTACSVARAAGRGQGTGACPSDAQRTNPSRRIQHTQLTESPRAGFAGDRDSTDTNVMVDRWCSKTRRSRIPEFVKTTRTNYGEHTARGHHSKQYQQTAV